MQAPDRFHASSHNVAIAKAIREDVPLARGDRILDLGCGTGALVGLLAAETPAHVVGLNRGAKIWFDRKLGYLAASPQELAVVRPGSSLVLGDGFALPFSQGSFRLVTLIEVLDHVRDNPSFLRAVGSVLSPGGYLCIVVPNRRQLLDHHFGEVSQLPLFGFYPCRLQDRLLARGVAKGSWLHHLFSREDLRQLLGADFDVLRLEYRPYVFDHLRERSPLLGFAAKRLYGILFRLFPSFGGTVFCLARKRG
ncbi:MAG: class I SAM-dependent methyltransferase [Candidatus Aenigmarchaeota archaeon]|nr:class I SAM-dependent methyltransferase [Candidatus Aenigmarchaeota archaeon]